MFDDRGLQFLDFLGEAQDPTEIAQLVMEAKSLGMSPQAAEQFLAQANFLAQEFKRPVKQESPAVTAIKERRASAEEDRKRKEFLRKNRTGAGLR